MATLGGGRCQRPEFRGHTFAMTLLKLLDAWNTFFHAEVSCATLVICSLLLFVFPEDAERCSVQIGGWFGSG